MLRKVFVLNIAFLFLCILTAYAEEAITITTYYPSPYGSYNELTTTGNTYLATTSGNVGIGTMNPKARIQFGDYGAIVAPSGDNWNGQANNLYYDGAWKYINTAPGVVAQLTGGGGFGIYTAPSGTAGTAATVTQRLYVGNTGNVGIGTVSPAGNLDVNGTIYQRGGLLHADYVFEPGYKLESIEEHAKHMWQEKHLKAVPKGKLDENGLEMLEIGADRRGLLEELEKAHIYIEQLNGRIKTLEEKIKQLQK